MSRMIGDGPTRGGENRARGAAHMLAVDDLHIDDLGTRGDAERGAGGSTGDCRAVCVAGLRILREGVVARANAAVELRMARIHATVEYIDHRARAGAGAPHRAVERRLAFRDAIERKRARAKRCIGLRHRFAGEHEHVLGSHQSAPMKQSGRNR
jgi:hypothetical protein